MESLVDKRHRLPVAMIPSSGPVVSFRNSISKRLLSNLEPPKRVTGFLNVLISLELGPTAFATM